MTRSNPLSGLVEILAALAAVRAAIPQFSDAAVVDPVVPTVRLAGAESAAEPLEVLSLAPPAELKAGSRVLILHRGGQLVLLGRTYGTPSAAPLRASSTRKNGLPPDRSCQSTRTSSVTCSWVTSVSRVRLSSGVNPVRSRRVA